MKIDNHIKLNIQEFQTCVDFRLEQWGKTKFLERLWKRDFTLWSPDIVPELTDRMGWLDLPETKPSYFKKVKILTQELKDEEISHILLLGMGGSSLAPEVFQKTFGNAKGYPELVILDSTHPTFLHKVADSLDIQRCLFLVSSKSGTTLETLSLFRFFWDRCAQQSEDPGRFFIAITDSGSPLMKIAGERGFREIFPSPTDVGGRFSALSFFGIVPAALIGMDVERFFGRAKKAAEDSSPFFDRGDSAGLTLGAVMAEVSMFRDKLTIFTSPSLESFPDWLEQLLAESTGKDGKGLVPVSNESRLSPEKYGQDRVFVFFYLDGDATSELKNFSSLLSNAGHPVISIFLKDKYDLAREIFDWEVAVSAAASALEIHPFNQPDVQLTKKLTKDAMEGIKRSGTEIPQDPVRIDIKDIGKAVKALKQWLGYAGQGGYISILAFLPRTSTVFRSLQDIRKALITCTLTATTLGFGPRYLHSTGQLHKGGPGNGIFLQLVDEPQRDIPVPETSYSFASLICAQSQGDFLALKQQGRHVLRINIGSNVLDGLGKLEELIKENLESCEK